MQVTEQANPDEKPPYIRPNHYVGKYGLRAEKIIFDYDLAYFPGAALKYILRAGNKPGVSKEEDYQKAVDSLKMAAEYPDCRRTGRTIFMEKTGSYIHLDASRIDEIQDNFEMPHWVSFYLGKLLSEIEERGQVSLEHLNYLIENLEYELDLMSSNTAEVSS